MSERVLRCAPDPGQRSTDQIPLLMRTLATHGLEGLDTALPQPDPSQRLPNAVQMRYKMLEPSPGT